MFNERWGLLHRVLVSQDPHIGVVMSTRTKERKGEKDNKSISFVALSQHCIQLCCIFNLLIYSVS